MGDAEFVDFSFVVCDETGVTAREAAVSAIIARDHLETGSVTRSTGGSATAPGSSLRARWLALVEDVRVLTGVLALELGTGAPADGPYDPARRAGLVHEATMRSESFALCAALTLLGLDAESDREAPAVDPWS